MTNLAVERVNVTEQVIEYLKTNIQRGVWKPGEKIASENELTNILSVSRASVRHAIQQLIAVGVLESYQGKGTFVKSMPIDFINENFDHLYVNAEILQLMEPVNCRIEFSGPNKILYCFYTHFQIRDGLQFGDRGLSTTL